MCFNLCANICSSCCDCFINLELCSVKKQSITSSKCTCTRELGEGNWICSDCCWIKCLNPSCICISTFAYEDKVSACNFLCCIKVCCTKCCTRSLNNINTIFCSICLIFKKNTVSSCKCYSTSKISIFKTSCDRNVSSYCNSCSLMNMKSFRNCINVCLGCCICSIFWSSKASDLKSTCSKI